MNRKRPSGARPFDETDSEKIPVIEERLRVGVRKEETARIRAVKTVHEEDLIVSGPVYSEDVHVERVPLNQYVDKAPQVRHEGETMIIPVVKEEVIVQTRLVLVEEVRITKRQGEVTVEKPVTLRKEEVIIERSEHEGIPGSRT